jgi:hypothetical protein
MGLTTELEVGAEGCRASFEQANAGVGIEWRHRVAAFATDAQELAARDETPDLRRAASDRCHDVGAFG